MLFFDTMRHCEKVVVFLFVNLLICLFCFSKLVL